MATTAEKPRIAQIPTDVEVDPVTLDIIEGALKSARFEMDAVLFRSAMSPVIREQHDEFPMITDPNGRMVVGQFGAYINEMMASWEGGIYPGDVILTSDPFKCSASISHTNDWLVLVPIFYEDELVGWSSQFGHQMDCGGPLPGSLPTGARTIFEEGLIIPPLKILERGEPKEDVLRLIFNNVRLPEMNRADLFAIVAGCRAGERRVIQLCERFGKDTYLAACQALLDRTYEAMRTLIQLAIPEEPQSFEDYVDDDGLGNGPFKMKLTIWREGDHAFFDWTGTDPQALGPVNFYLSEGMFKMFIGVYLIMVNDPQILFNDGFYPLLHIVLPEGCLLRPRFPSALGCRTHALARLFDVLGGALCKNAPELNTASGYGTSPYMLYSGWDSKGDFFYSMEILYGGIPGRPIGDGMDGHSWWPLFENIPTEYLEAYYPLRIDGYTTVTDSGGAGLPPRRQRRREALRLPRAGRGLDPRRPLADAALGRARRLAGRALVEAAPARRRDGAGAAVQVRPRRGGARRHARLPDGRRRRLEGPARPARRGGRARRRVRARVVRLREGGLRRGRRRRGCDRGRARAAAGGARRRARVRLRADARGGHRALRGGDGPHASEARGAAALVAAPAGRGGARASARGGRAARADQGMKAALSVRTAARCADSDHVWLAGTMPCSRISAEQVRTMARFFAGDVDETRLLAAAAGAQLADGLVAAVHERELCDDRRRREVRARADPLASGHAVRRLRRAGGLRSETGARRGRRQPRIHRPGVTARLRPRRLRRRDRPASGRVPRRRVAGRVHDGLLRRLRQAGGGRVHREGAGAARARAGLAVGRDRPAHRSRRGEPVLSKYFASAFFGTTLARCSPRRAATRSSSPARQPRAASARRRSTPSSTAIGSSSRARPSATATPRRTRPTSTTWTRSTRTWSPSRTCSEHWPGWRGSSLIVRDLGDSLAGRAPDRPRRPVRGSRTRLGRAKEAGHESLTIAAERHDDGWAVWEQAPQVDEEGAPVNFLAVDVRSHLAFYRAGIAAVTEQDPEAGLLVAMHGAGIYRQRYGLDEALGLARAAEAQEDVDAFVAEQEAKFAGELDARRRDYELLQFFDRFSLYFCLRDVEAGEAAELQGYRFEPVGAVAGAARPVPVRRAARALLAAPARRPEAPVDAGGPPARTRHGAGPRRDHDRVKLIGSGRASEIFDLGDGRVLRRFKAGGRPQREALVMRHAAANGFPVPRVLEVHDDSLVLERVDGPTMLQDALERGSGLDDHAATLARLHAELHEIEAPSELGPVVWCTWTSIRRT